MRYALGASRGRIVGQLFVEALVLAAAAAGVALALIWPVFRYLLFSEGDDPFWWNVGLSPTTVLFAAGLALVAGLIVGAAPARQATGRLLRTGLHGLGRRTSMQLGATWTALIVAQIAFAVAVLPAAIDWSWGTLRPGVLGPGFSAGEFLTAQLVMDQTTPQGPEGEVASGPLGDRFGSLQAELVRQLATAPAVSAVTVSAAVPGLEPSASVELDGLPPSAVVTRWPPDKSIRQASLYVSDRPRRAWRASSGRSLRHSTQPCGSRSSVG